MIDQDKMRALAEKLREDYRNSIKVLPWPYRSAISSTPMEAADAIDLLLAEVEASDQKRKEAILDAEKARDERNRAHVKLNAEWIEKTNALRAELQSAAADKRDALAFRDLMAKVIREINHGEYNHPYRGIENAPMHGHKVPGIWDSDNGAKSGTPCAWCATWNAARAALAQRQGEGS
ncbi:hypothetical protein [Burkholderia vietnamiensis]|uniref:hypothetical protein n=1 Tax=Burkholderia vietnamiensis TaxID=60552 RepID=UPI001594D5DA|nr:hypothetical protein [Burkholderia vietnamiensis]